MVLCLSSGFVYLNFQKNPTLSTIEDAAFANVSGLSDLSLSECALTTINYMTFYGKS